MVCTTADEVHARLALHALWQPGFEKEGKEGREVVEDDDEGAGVSALHKRLSQEMHDILHHSLNRRLDRIGKGRTARAAAAEAGADSGEEVKTVDSVVQTLHSTLVSTTKLQDKMPKAFVRAEVASRPKKFHTYGPSSKQFRFNDPPEEKPEVCKEGVTLRSTLQAVRQCSSSRVRQIENLTTQREACKEVCAGKAADVEAATQRLNSLRAEPEQRVPPARQERLKATRSRVEDIRRQLERAQTQAKYYEDLSKRQRSFYVNSMCVLSADAREIVKRHPCGAICVAGEPERMEEEAEESYDIGTAFANPYVCDSWPFEANVLASRNHHQQDLEALDEESKEDIEEEMRPPNPFRAGMSRLQLPVRSRDDEDDDNANDDDDDDSEDDRYGGPSATARSL